MTELWFGALHAPGARAQSPRYRYSSVPRGNPSTGRWSPQLRPDLDFKVGWPRQVGGLGHPVEQIVPQVAHLGGPGRRIDGDHQDVLVEPLGTYVAGDRRSHDLLPLGKQPGQTTCLGQLQWAGKSI